jgi:hypothetical protein
LRGNEALKAGTTPQFERAKQRAVCEGKKKERKEGERGRRAKNESECSLIICSGF